MPSSLLSRVTAWCPPSLAALRRPRPSRADLRALGRRLGHFWVVWSALLLVHEAGHAITALRQGLTVRRVTVGAGPVLQRWQVGDAQLVLRLVPVAGMTTLGPARSGAAAVSDDGRWREWRRQLATLGGGVLATLVLAVGVAGAVAARERVSGSRWVWGRFLVADAVVLTVFNFLPVPPLDGGRAAFGAFTAWRGTPLSGDALFWVQVGGLALALAPMTLWTHWTSRIDAAAMRWGVPAGRR